VANPRVLIICYSFPPVPGIGGRRWAKFAKELIRLNYKVLALGAVCSPQEVSEWSNDANGTTRLEIPLRYPSSLLNTPTSLPGKIKYRIDLFFVKLFSKGNYFDKAVFWGPVLRKKVARVIEREQVTHVIVSGAPFSLYRHVQPLIATYKQVKFYADIRDPWTENVSAYGFQSLSEKRKNFERQSESTVFKSFNKVFTVNDYLTDYFKSRYSPTFDQFYTLPNGFDEDELNISQREVTNKVTFVFAGSFYDNTHHYIAIICAAIEKYIHNHKDSQPEFVFYGPNYHVVKNLIPEHLNAFFKFGYEKDKSIVNKLILNADYCMLFLSDDINYSLSTKFCEYIAFKKPILLFSTPGITADFINMNKLGVHIQNISEVNKVIDLFNKEAIMGFPESFDVSKFSIKNITKELHQLLSK